MNLSSSAKALYLHGLPGSAHELSAALPPDVLGLAVLDRMGHAGSSFDEALLASFDARVTAPLTLIGFSLGAMSALKLAALRPQMVRRVLLFSPAAPLELGEFLPEMAGRAVFEAARQGRWALAGLSMLQQAAVTLAPQRLLTQMFSKSADSERVLAGQAAFQQALLRSLRYCLVEHRAAYHRELLAYVRPWARDIDGLACEVRVWHGDADTWAPLAMGQALRTQLSGRVELHVCKGLGHFSTLHQCLPDALNAVM